MGRSARSSCISRRRRRNSTISLAPSDFPTETSNRPPAPPGGGVGGDGGSGGVGWCGPRNRSRRRRRKLAAAGGGGCAGGVRCRRQGERLRPRRRSGGACFARGRLPHVF